MAAVHANKRNKAQREADRPRIAEMYKSGMTQFEIGQEVGLSQSQVSQILMSIRREWFADSIETFDQKVQAELLKIDSLELTYLQQWEASLNDIISTSTENKSVSLKTADENGNIIELPAVETKKTRRVTKTNGDKDFLDGVKWCIEQRLKITGGYAATKTQNLNVDLSTLTDEQLDRLEAGEPLEQVLKRDRVAA